MNQDDILKGLNPFVSDNVKQVLSLLEEMGNPCLLESGFRSFAQQDDLFALGRTVKNPDGVTEAKPMGNIVTNAHGGDSWHNYGLAVDLTRLDKNGNKSWDLPYMPIGVAGKNFGFEWGGDWTSFRDLPHLQMRFGYLLHQVKDIVLAEGLDSLWKRIADKGWPNA